MATRLAAASPQHQSLLTSLALLYTADPLVAFGQGKPQTSCLCSVPDLRGAWTLLPTTGRLASPEASKACVGAQD